MIPFSIHHLSDIHTGPDQKQPVQRLTTGRRKRQSCWSLDEYRTFLKFRANNELPDMIIISGDLTQRAEESEFEVVEKKIRQLIERIKKKDSSWRKKTTKQKPYVLMVPGNHDLKWLQGTESHRKKIQLYSEMASRLCADGSVLSSQAPGCEGYCDLGDDINIFFYLFDTTSQGGRKDPISKGKTRTDAGFIRPVDLARMSTVMKTKAFLQKRVKIAVMHHNPTSVPTADIDYYDAIVNAGIAKAKLISAQFDLILHGHRHVLAGTHERPLFPPEKWEQGLFILGVDSFGTKDKIPFLEIKFSNTKTAHCETSPDSDHIFPPGCLFEVRSVEHDRGEYIVSNEPAVGEIIHRPIYTAFGSVMRHLGRHVANEKRTQVLEQVQRAFRSLKGLHAGLVDWGKESSKWIEKFHNNLGVYTRIYATDISVRDSYSAPMFDLYLREQYKARMLHLTQVRKLCYSPLVCQAIKRTGWRPDPVSWPGITLAESTEERGLEIVRIVVREKDAPGVREELEILDFDHRWYAIPLFVLESDKLDDFHKRDFALGFKEGVGIMAQFEFDDGEGGEGEVILKSRPRGLILTKIFESLLANDALKTVDEFLGYKPMLREPSAHTEFVENYDKTRAASPSIVTLLERTLKPDKSKCGLDIGCGTGNYTIPFKKAFARVTGLDLSEEMLAAARKKSPDVDWQHGSALNSGIPDNSYDAVWLVSTLHYFQDVHLEQLFQEIYRILLPGGVMVAGTEFLEQHHSLWQVEYFPSLRQRYKHTCLSSKRFCQLLKHVGFTRIKIEVLDSRHDKCDSFLRIGHNEPKLYLNDKIRDGMPVFRNMAVTELETGLAKLKKDIESRKIYGLIKQYNGKATLKGDIGFLIAHR